MRKNRKNREQEREKLNMLLNELIDKIEREGYRLEGKQAIASDIMQAEVRLAPMVFIPSLPPVQAECRMEKNVLLHDGDVRPGWARIEGAAMAGWTLVHLVFMPNEQAGRK